MSSPSTASDPIPRYIRYKARHKKWLKYWDDEIERANVTVHERVQRMKRDKLCSGCARFDWERTQLYTREVVRKDGRLPVRNNVITLAQQNISSGRREYRSRTGHKIIREIDHNHYDTAESLDGMQDKVSWLEYEAALLESPGTSELMKHPRFHWDINYSQQQNCTLCQSLCNILTIAKPLAIHRTRVRCLAGPLLEGGNNHDCSLSLHGFDDEISLQQGQPLNAIIFDVCHTNGDGHVFESYRCYLRRNVSGTEVLSSAAPHFCLTTRPLGHTIDFNLAAEWLKTCDDSHQHAKEFETRDVDRKLPGFRLIDITKRCIVKSSLNARYAALSYTWGDKKQYCLIQRDLKKLEQINSLNGPDLPLTPTVLDAMEVCRRLQIRYLWIDALCIIHDDVQGKHSQIQNMHQVYGNAHLTIVAASGTLRLGGDTRDLQTALPGLAGVSIPRSPNWTVIHLDAVAYSTGPADPFNTLDLVLGQSHWFSRGWTFQELIMSQRILVFTESEAFFYCPKGLFTESVCLGKNGNEAIRLASIHRIGLCNFLQRRISRHRLTPMPIRNRYSYYQSVYLHLLKEYLRRELSFESDILNAFGGILSAQESVFGEFYWGLPLCFFVRSLLLEFRPAHDFRIGFPTWSWAGKKLLSSSKPAGWVIREGARGLYLGKLKALVHIYSYDKHGQFQNLVGPYNNRLGFEGYCSSFIETFNRYTLLDPLPVHPSMKRDTCVAQLPTDMGSMLLFWTQTACMTTTTWVTFDFPNPPERFEVILVAGIPGVKLKCGKNFTDNVKSLDDFVDQRLDDYYGIVIERQGEYARRIGIARHITRKAWIAANPRKELIMLI